MRSLMWPSERVYMSGFCVSALEMSPWVGCARCSEKKDDGAEADAKDGGEHDARGAGISLAAWRDRCPAASRAQGRWGVSSTPVSSRG